MVLPTLGQSIFYDPSPTNSSPFSDVPWALSRNRSFVVCTPSFPHSIFPNGPPPLTIVSPIPRPQSFDNATPAPNEPRWFQKMSPPLPMQHFSFFQRRILCPPPLFCSSVLSTFPLCVILSRHLQVCHHHFHHPLFPSKISRIPPLFPFPINSQVALCTNPHLYPPRPVFRFPPSFIFRAPRHAGVTSPCPRLFCTIPLFPKHQPARLVVASQSTFFPHHCPRPLAFFSPSSCVTIRFFSFPEYTGQFVQTSTTPFQESNGGFIGFSLLTGAKRPRNHKSNRFLLATFFFALPSFVGT